MIHFVQWKQQKLPLRLLAALFAGTLLSSAATVPVSRPPRPIRLEVDSHHRVRKVTIESAAVLHVSLGTKQQTLSAPVQILWRSTALVAVSGGKTTSLTPRRITVTSDAPITLAMGQQSSQISRSLEIRRTAHGLQLIAVLPLEEYLRNVVTGEGGDMPAQALQAMAVLARTWALENRDRHQRGGFDFCSSTHCEVWPLHPPSKRAIAAVEKTRGEVLAYHGHLAEVFYSADCGGKTAPGSSFSEGGKPYLRTHADPWCAWSPPTNWTTTIAKSKLTPLLVKVGWLAARQQPWRLEVMRRDASGRVSSLVLSGTAQRVIRGRDFRFLVDRGLGWNRIKSTLFDLTDAGGELRITGHGLGHGAGLCEAGAEGMARAGRTYRQILAFYFPGTTLQSLPAPKAKQQATMARSRPRFVPAAWHGDDSGNEWHYAASGACQVKYQNCLPQALLHLCPHLVETAEHRTGLPLNGPLRLTVYPTVSAFIAAIGRPGWIAAATRGHEIGLLPLDLIERQHRLSDVLRHEILHVLIGDHSAPGTSLCLQEGAVLTFTGESHQLPSARDLPSRRSLDDILRTPHSPAEFNRALAACAAKASTTSSTSTAKQPCCNSCGKEASARSTKLLPMSSFGV